MKYKVTFFNRGKLHENNKHYLLLASTDTSNFGNTVAPWKVWGTYETKEQAKAASIGLALYKIIKVPNKYYHVSDE